MVTQCKVKRNEALRYASRPSCPGTQEAWNVLDEAIKRCTNEIAEAVKALDDNFSNGREIAELSEDFEILAARCKRDIVRTVENEEKHLIPFLNSRASVPSSLSSDHESIKKAACDLLVSANQMQKAAAGRSRKDTDQALSYLRGVVSELRSLVDSHVHEEEQLCLILTKHFSDDELIPVVRFVPGEERRKRNWNR